MLNLGQNRQFFYDIEKQYGYAASNLVHHFTAIHEFNLELQSRNAQFGSKSIF